MIFLMVYVALISSPADGEAIVIHFTEHIRIFAIVTFVGGTVGGYITFAGGHRLLDAGIKGVESLPQITKSSVTGIAVTGIMRIALFLAVFGVVSQGLAIDPSNPAASVFRLAAGEMDIECLGLSCGLLPSHRCGCRLYVCFFYSFIHPSN